MKALDSFRIQSSTQVAGLIELLRLPNCAAAAIATLLGAHLSGGWMSLESPAVITVAFTLCLIVAACNVVNDFCDVAADCINSPRRPIPSGRVSRRTAAVLASLLSSTALILAYTLVNTRWMLIAAGVLLLGLSYSFGVKSTVLIGNALVGLLCASLVLIGGWSAGRLGAAAFAASVQVFLFMFAYEILNSLVDREGDGRSGIHTVATRWGRIAAVRIFQGVIVLFALSAIAPMFFTLSSDRYLYALLPCTIGPTLGVAAFLSVKATDEKIHISRRILKYVWFTSLVPLTMMK